VTRPELEARCDALHLMHLSTDSDRDLAEWIALEEREVRRRENPEGYGDERRADDWAAHAE
jgi:hypothetical protein